MNPHDDPFYEDRPQGSIDPTEHQKYSLEQQMMEAKLEILRSHRQQKEAQFSRVINFLFVFAAAGVMAWLLDAKGYSPLVSVGGSASVIAILGAWWAFRKPY